MKKIFSILLFVIFNNLAAELQSQTDIFKDMGQSQLRSASVLNVSIGGFFIVKGTFPAALNERVDGFVTRIFNEAREQMFRLATDEQSRKRVFDELGKYSLRGIKLIRVNGEEQIIDLERYRQDGDLRNNPYLKNDDRLIFSSHDIERNFFVVSGAVNKSGKFLFVEGDKLSDALVLAQGINPAYENVNRIQITRLSYDGLSMDSAFYNLSEDVQLKRGDIIKVIADETQRIAYGVVVFGEVENPGYVAITKDGLPLKTVIQKAGGLKNTAALHRARIFSGNSVTLLLEQFYGIKLRSYPDLFELEVAEKIMNIQNSLMYRMSNVNEQDSSYFFMENRLRQLLDNGPIDFSNIHDNDSEAARYIVKNGDIIIIPQKTNSVVVFGQVRKPGRINFVEGKDFRYYLTRAGGTGEYAEEDVMVIKAETKEWIDALKNEVTIEEGDFIYVPRQISRSFNYHVNLIGEYLGIAGSIATIVLLLIQISK